MKAYKMFRVRKDGTLGSLFCNRRAVVPVGQWLEAEEHPTKGLAFRPGWHCHQAEAPPHLKLDAKGETRVIKEVEVEDYQVLNRPESQGGVWYLARRMRICQPN